MTTHDAGEALKYCFGPYEIDVAARELRRAGAVLDIQSRVFDLLVYLARHHDRMVDKDELHEAVWPGRIVTEAALASAVMKARKAVGDEANEQAVIRTLHGHGYRFVAELEVVTEASESVDDPLRHHEPARVSGSFLSGRRTVLALTGGTLALLAFILLLMSFPRQASGPPRLAILPVFVDTASSELAWTGLGLMGYASEQASARLPIRTVPVRSVIDIAEAFGWSGSLMDPGSERVIDRLRAVTGASHVLALRLGDESGSLRLNYGLRYPDGALLQGDLAGESGTELVGLALEQIQAVMMAAGAGSSGREALSLEAPVSESFARGLGLSLEGRCAEALAHFQVVIDQQPELFPPRYEYALCLKELDHAEEAARWLSDLAAEQREQDDSGTLSRTLLALADLRRGEGRLQEAEDLLLEALDRARSRTDEEMAGAILHALARVSEDRSDWLQSRERLEQALKSYDRAGREVPPGSILAALSNLALERGDFSESERLLDRALKAFRAAGDERNEAVISGNTGYLNRRLSPPDEDRLDASEAPEPQFAPNSIAVLPFVNLSSDPEQEYFSDGISEELLSLLSRIPELMVISRSSAYSIKGRDMRTAEIARKLRVAHVLEGSVRKAGSRVRISAHLIETRFGSYLWSATFDRTLHDIFQIQDEIAGAVVEALKVTLLGGAPRTESIDAEAYSLFLQARYLNAQGNASTLEQSIDLYKKVLEIAPDYARAWRGLAVIYANQANRGLRSGDESYVLAREAIDRALDIDPDYAMAHAMLGLFAMTFNVDVAGAARHLEYALSLEPTNLVLLSYGSSLLLRLGRIDEAITIREYDVSHDPLDPIGYNNLAWAYLLAARPDKVTETIRTLQMLAPEYSGAHHTLGRALLLTGELEAALEAMRLEPSKVWRLHGLAVVHHAMGQAPESDQALDQMIEDYGEDRAYHIAGILAYRQEADRAFEWLSVAAKNKAASLTYIAVEPLFRAIHDDPRWLPFLTSIGMAPDQLGAVPFTVALPE